MFYKYYFCQFLFKWTPSKYNNYIDLRFRIANFSLQRTVQGCTLQRLRKEDRTLLMQFRFLYVNLQ